MVMTLPIISPWLKKTLRNTALIQWPIISAKSVARKSGKLTSILAMISLLTKLEKLQTRKIGPHLRTNIGTNSI